jgi:hypothetical protein
MARTTYPDNGDNTPAARAQRETYWRRIIERWKASGLPKTTFCSREGVGHSAFYWWLEELDRRDGKPKTPRTARRKLAVPKRRGFVPVTVVTSKPPTRQPIEVLVAGQVIRVIPDFDPETFMRLVAVLEGQPLASEVTMEDERC